MNIKVEEVMQCQTGDPRRPTIAMTAIMIEEMMEEATRIRGFNTQGRSEEQPKYFGRGNRESSQHQSPQSLRHSGREGQGQGPDRNRNDQRYDPRRNDGRTGNNPPHYKPNRSNDVPIANRGTKRSNQEHDAGPFKQPRLSDEYTQRSQQQQFSSVNLTTINQIKRMVPIANPTRNLLNPNFKITFVFSKPRQK